MKCTKCNGTGYYADDHNHSQPCEECCPHNKGWFVVSEIHVGYMAGRDNRCCKAGCGRMYRDLMTEGGYNVA